MKRAFVSGGCGFLGSWIVRGLVDRGIQVRTLALPGESSDNLQDVDIEILRGDIRDRSIAERSVAGVDTLFHAAAIYADWMPNPYKMYEVNLSGTFNMLEAARRANVERCVYTASIVSLGRPEPGQLGDEETAYEAWDIDFSYSRSKLYSRMLAEDFARWDMDVRVVCPGVVLGPGDIAPTPSGQLIINALDDASPPVYTEGGASYVDVRDAAECHILAAEKGAAGERYVASAHNLNTHDLMTAIGRAGGRPRRLFKVPVGVARAYVMGLEAVARRTGKPPLVSRNFFEFALKPAFFDNTKARSELGANFRPLEVTLRDAIGYFRERGLL